MPSNGRLPFRVIQSPMCSCTDLPFRVIARRFGCELAFAEMVKDRPVLEGNAKTAQLLATSETDRPLGVQLAGREPNLLADAARKLEQETGACVIDLNLGCPVRKIVRTGCGSALLKEPAQVGRILERMISAVGVPVTVKMRTGLGPEEESSFLEVARVAEKSGAAWITVHGRTRRQRLSGMNNHEAIRAVKESVSIPVVGNGDIRRGADAARMIRETGCDAVMVARGALGNPWIYREVAAYLEKGEEIAPPALPERIAVLREHFDLLRKFYGDRAAFYRARRVVHWFVKGIRGCHELRNRANRIASVEDFEFIVRSYEEAAARTSAPSA